MARHIIVGIIQDRMVTALKTVAAGAVYNQTIRAAYPDPEEIDDAALFPVAFVIADSMKGEYLPCEIGDATAIYTVHVGGSDSENYRTIMFQLAADVDKLFSINATWAGIAIDTRITGWTYKTKRATGEYQATATVEVDYQYTWGAHGVTP